MRKSVVLALTLVFVMALAGVASAYTLDVVGNGNDKISTGRTMDDYVNALVKLTNADKAGDVVYPEENKVKYLFVPLYKGGELIGYGTWVNTIIYSHPEDIIAVLKMAENSKTKERYPVVLKWKPLDANDHHPEMQKEEFLSKFYGMTLETTFDPDVDVISGSTLSSNTFFFELRNALLIFADFGPGAE